MILSTRQLGRLAEALKDTSNNVYALCRGWFGIEADESVFDALEEVFRVFRCDKCAIWRSCDQQDHEKPWLCSMCVFQQKALGPAYEWELRVIRERTKLEEQRRMHEEWLKKQAHSS